MNHQSKIVVIGSCNTDMVVKSEHLPAPGETVLGGQFQMIPGGKGANQAVAAAKLAGDVTFIAKVGNDLFGQQAIKGFGEIGIKSNAVLIDNKAPSGVALIMVDDNGENSISVALGANNELTPDDIENQQAIIAESDFLLIQLEIPIETVEKAVSLAKETGTQVILNPAPAQALSEELLNQLDFITPNETETYLLTNIDVTDEASARQAAQVLRQKGVGTVIITLGAKGVYVLNEELDGVVDGYEVSAVDTTAAGDTFNGALTVGLAEGMMLREAIDFANQAAAFSVTQLGAQTSAPTKQDLLTITK